MEDKKKNETRQSTMQNRMENMNGQKPKTISIVISVYNEEKALHEFYREATPVFEALPWNYELIFVNDGSADASGQILAELAAADLRGWITASGRASCVWMPICSIRRNVWRR